MPAAANVYPDHPLQALLALGLSAMGVESLQALSQRRFAAVLFDMDGTLVDSLASVERCWVQLSREFGFDAARLPDFHGIPAKGVIAELVAEPDRDAAFRRIEALEVGDTEGMIVLPGAREALATLRGAHTAIVTSATQPLYAARIGAAGLVPPETVVTADQVTRGKPSPEPFLLGAQRLGVDPADCLVVEDAPGGLRAGRDAGCATLALTTTVTRDALVAGGLADAIVDSLADVEFVVHEDGIEVRSAR